MTTTAELVGRITPEQALLLRAALLSGEPAQRAWLEWRASVDFDKVDEHSQRLLPYLAKRLDELAPDEELRGLIRGLYRYAYGRNYLLLRGVTPVFERLRNRGIPVLLLKGLALLRPYGGDWGARPMYDIDVLVPRDRATNALEVLQDFDWEPELDRTHDWVRTRAVAHAHGWGFCHREARLDLHWKVMLGSLGSRADDLFWEGAEPVDIGGLRMMALGPGDLLLHMLLHGTSFNAPPIQWIADAVLIIRWAGADAVGDRLADQARDHRQLGSVRVALETIAEVLGTDEVAAVLRRVRREQPSRLERAAARREDSRIGAPLRELARRSDTTTGILGGAAALTSEHLDLSLRTRPWVAALHAAAGRSNFAGRALRRATGLSSRTPVKGSPVAAGDEIRLTHPPLADRYCGPGWSHVEPYGVMTHGGEARLVIPLGAGLVDRDVLMTLGLATVQGHRRIEIVVNESRVAAVSAGPQLTTVTVLIEAAIARRFSPLEVALRAPARDRLRGRGFLDFYVSWIRFDKALPAPAVDVEFW